MSRFPILMLPAVLAGLFCASPATAQDRGQPWKHHSIDDSARGADGVRLADANGDGLLDIATGWEEAGLIRLYLNPGPQKTKDPWPKVTVGRVKSPEDAVLVDVDGDGALDIVSCCEGNTRSVFVHWAPRDKTRVLIEAAWNTEPVPALAGRQMAMYCLPLQIDGQQGVDLVIGSKGPGAKIGWLRSPANPRDLAAWQYHPLCDAGWIMSLVASDVDRDGDQDLVASDRKGKNAGCLWLESPGAGPEQDRPWSRHPIGPTGKEVMFLHYTDWDGDGQLDLLVPTFAKQLFCHRRTTADPVGFEVQELPYPESIGKGKAVRAADIDRDGSQDLVISAENFEGTSGLVWCSRQGQTHEISGSAGPKGLKFDDVQTLDLDADGDLDILTTEERTGLGVVWYENPAK